MDRVRSARRVGFGARVAASGVATAVLVTVILGWHRPAGSAVRALPPWPAPPAAQVPALVRAAGLALLPAPGQVVRYAVHLDVIVDGRAVPVPAGIGVDYPARQVSVLFTADASGIVHVEADSQGGTYTLGQLFAEWRVTLTAGRLGGLRGSAADPVAVYLDGRRVAGNPGSVVLRPHQEIAVVYRPGAVRVPVGYAFPAGT